MCRDAPNAWPPLVLLLIEGLWTLQVESALDLAVIVIGIFRVCVYVLYVVLFVFVECFVDVSEC